MKVFEFAHKIGFRKILVYLSLIAVCAIITIVLFQGPSTLGDIPDDFVAYWSAGRLIAFQENPYSLENIVKLNPFLGFDEIVLVPAYYPPTVLPILIPFGLLSFQVSRFLWLLLSIVVIFYCGFWIWRVYGGPQNKRWMIFICFLSLAPFYFSLIEGQITFLILLGLTGFLIFVGKRKWFLAGIFLALLTIKFQLVYLVWIAVSLWVVDQKRWTVIAGLISSSMLLLGIAILLQPSIIIDYLSLILNSAPVHCEYISLSALTCKISGEGNDWSRYLPAVAGAIWLIIFYFRSKDDWSWREKISIILIVSVMTAPLAWMHDQLLFLIPIIEIVILMVWNGFRKKEFGIIGLYLLINIVAFSLIPGYRIYQSVFIWMPVIFLIIFIYSKEFYSQKN